MKISECAEMSDLKSEGSKFVSKKILLARVKLHKKISRYPRNVTTSSSGRDGLYPSTSINKNLETIWCYGLTTNIISSLYLFNFSTAITYRHLQQDQLCQIPEAAT